MSIRKNPFSVWIPLRIQETPVSGSFFRGLFPPTCREIRFVSFPCLLRSVISYRSVPAPGPCGPRFPGETVRVHNLTPSRLCRFHNRPEIAGFPFHLASIRSFPGLPKAVFLQIRPLTRPWVFCILLRMSEGRPSEPEFPMISVHGPLGLRIPALSGLDTFGPNPAAARLERKGIPAVPRSIRRRVSEKEGLS